MPSRIEKVNLSLRAVSLLRKQKEEKTYEELKEKTGLPITVLNRYVKGRVLPNRKKSEKIIALFRKELKDEVDEKMIRKGRFIDNSGLLSDASLMKEVASAVSENYFEKVDVVVTAAVDGIPIASFMADILGAKLVYAKENMETGIEKFIQATVKSKGSGLATTWFIPARFFDEKTRVLFVDDVLRSGDTMSAIADAVKGNPQGFFFLACIGDEAIKRLEKIAPVDCFVRCSK